MSPTTSARPAADVAWALLAVAATLAAGGAVAIRAVEFGSSAGGWMFRYVAPPRWPALLAGLAGGAAIASLHALARRHVDARPATIVAAALAGGVAAQLALHGLAPAGLAELLVSDVATGFHAAAAKVGPVELLTDFDRVAARLPMHARVNMPGKVLLFHALGATTPDPRLQAVIVLVLSSVSGLALYAVAARAFGRRVGLDAMALWLLAPSKVAFQPLPNVVSPLPAIVGVWCMGRCLDGRGFGWAAAAGVAAYVTTFFDPLALWIGVAFAPLLADAVAVRGVPVRRVALLLAVALAGLAACHAAVVAATGFDVVARLGAMVDIVREFNARWKRPRDVWLVANLKDAALACGPAVVVGALAAAGAALAALASARDRRDAWAAGPWLALAALGVLATLDVICLNRGEVARLWIPLYLPVQAAVAWWAADRALARGAVVACTVAWAALTVSTVGYCLP